jgi:hypothetical protein
LPRHPIHPDYIKKNDTVYLLSNLKFRAFEVRNYSAELRRGNGGIQLATAANLNTIKDPEFFETPELNHSGL